MEISTTVHGKPCAHYEGYSYIVKRKNENGTVIWRCTKQRSMRCRGMLKTKGSNILTSNVHDCRALDGTIIIVQETPARENKRTANKRARRKVTQIPKIYPEEFAELDYGGYDSVSVEIDHSPTMIEDGKITVNIGFIGAGNMAKSIGFGLMKSGLLRDSCQIYASAPSMTNLEEWKELGANVSTENDFIIRNCPIVFLAVKPQFAKCAIEESLKNYDCFKFPLTVFVSIMVGITIDSLWRMIKDTFLRLKKDNQGRIHIIRTMPNTPLLVGEGCTVFCKEKDADIEADVMNVIRSILSVNGFCEEVDEKLMNAIGALSGSGPAYVYQMIEALSDGGVKLGIPRELSIKLAAQTVLGGAKMVLETGKHPGELKDEVCSPGGSTIAGISAMEKQGVRYGLISAVEAAYLRSEEISKST